MRTAPAASEPAAPGRLLSPRTLARLERLRLKRPRRFAPGGAGARREGDARSVGRGGFADFLDHRAYEPGDDFRRIDWPLYARHDRLYVREFGREIEPEEWILVDASASMAAPPEKALAARRLAFALAFVALRSSRSVRLAAVGGAGGGGGGEGLGTSRALSTAASIPKVERVAASLAFDAPGSASAGAGAGAGAGDLAGDLRRLRTGGGAAGRAGVTVLSDLLFDGEPLVGELRALAAEGHDVAILQLAARDDLEIGAIGRARFRGAEAADGEPLDLAVERDDAERFAAIAAQFVDGWRRVARAHGFRHALFRAEAGSDEERIPPFLFGLGVGSPHGRRNGAGA